MGEYWFLESQFVILMKNYFIQTFGCNIVWTHKP